MTAAVEVVFWMAVSASIPLREQSNIDSSPAQSSGVKALIELYKGIQGSLKMILSSVHYFVIYSRRRTIHIENNSGGKNVVEGTTVSNDLTITHDMAETIATDDVSVGDRNNFVTTTTSTNNATVAMTEDGPRFVPDTTYSHTVKLHDVA